MFLYVSMFTSACQIHTNDPIDFVSQADFLAHRDYYAKVVKVLYWYDRYNRMGRVGSPA